jgi:acyl-CoA synthetase (AMP-forming)/AMP-acid ligase II
MNPFSWLDVPDGAALDLADVRGWTPWSRGRLAERMASAANALLRLGVQPADRVAVVGAADGDLIAVFLAALWIGAHPAWLPPRPLFSRPRDDRSTLLERLAPKTVVAVDHVAALTHPGPLPPRVPGGIIQFTSGSSGPRRPILVSSRALSANLESIRTWLRWGSEDVAASWLPLSHDMGLVGCLLAALACRSRLWLMRPVHYIRSPTRFLRLLSDRRVALTAMPGFGLDLLLRRAPRLPEGLDLSSLRAVVLGAERLNADLLRRAADHLAPAGLDANALLPAYGMAEATLVVSGTPLGSAWPSLRLSQASLRPGAVAETQPDGVEVVGCGLSLRGLKVTVRHNGIDLPEGCVGELRVRGPSVLSGQHDTGDIGLIRGGVLFVLGRAGEGVKVRGRMVLAENLDQAARDRGVHQGVMFVLGQRGAAPELLALAESEEAAEAATEVLAVAAEQASWGVWRVPRGTIPRTPSGKPQRRRVWRWFCANRMPGTLAAGTITAEVADG